MAKEMDKMNALMAELSHLGAEDSEPCWALDKVTQAAEDGRVFPAFLLDTHSNPWDLYSSMPGCTKANMRLTAQAKKVYAEYTKELKAKDKSAPKKSSYAWPSR